MKFPRVFLTSQQTGKFGIATFSNKLLVILNPLKKAGELHNANLTLIK
jgi:hypothetical protein